MKGYHKKQQGVGILFDEIFLINGARTGFGKLCGTLSQVSPTDLGIFAAKAAIDRAGVSPEDFDQVVFSNITQSSIDAYYLPRHVGLFSGIPATIPALLVQRLCGTGFETIVTAAEQITLGKADLVLSGAAENMSLSPTVSYGARMGYPLGGVKFFDFLAESLKDTAVGGHMGCTAETLKDQYKITRKDVDEFALRSQDLAVAAKDRLTEEMTPVFSTVFEATNLLSRKVRLPRKVNTFAADENIRPSDMATISKLPPAFLSDGIHTAANSSGIVDGAGANVVASGSFVNSRGLKPLAKIVAAAAAGVDPRVMGIGPVPAIRTLLEITGLALEEIGLIEINEAFAGQFIACERELGLNRDICNVNGGAIAIGHPLSATGARIMLSLAMEMKRRGVRYGIGAACVGGGQGSAILIENLS